MREKAFRADSLSREKMLKWKAVYRGAQVITPKSAPRCLLGANRPGREGKEWKLGSSGRECEHFPKTQVWP